MGARITYDIGPWHFDSQKEALALAREIRHRGPRVLNGDEAAFALGLWRQSHPEDERAVREVRVEKSDGGKSGYCFTIIFDDEVRHFSGGKALSRIGGRPVAPDYKDALRNTVDSEIRAWRDRWWETTEDTSCPVCGVPLHKGIAEADHFEPRFAQLATAFLDYWPTPPLVPGDDERYLLGEPHATRWRLVHGKLAKLRMICRADNQARNTEKPLYSDYEVFLRVVGVLFDFGDPEARDLAWDEIEMDMETHRDPFEAAWEMAA